MLTNLMENTVLITDPVEFYKKKKKIQYREPVKLLSDY